MYTVLPFRWTRHQVKIELTGRVREFGEHNLNRVVDTMDIDCPHSTEKPDPEEAADAPQKNAATSGRVPQSFLGQMVLSCALLLGLGWLVPPSCFAQMVLACALLLGLAAWDIPGLGYPW